MTTSKALLKPIQTNPKTKLYVQLRLINKYTARKKEKPWPHVQLHFRKLKITNQNLHHQLSSAHHRRWGLVMPHLIHSCLIYSYFYFSVIISILSHFNFYFNITLPIKAVFFFPSPTTYRNVYIIYDPARVFNAT